LNTKVLIIFLKIKNKSKTHIENVVNQCDEIILKFVKGKPIKSIRLKDHLDISIMCPLGTKNLINKKKSFEKDF
jgi:hypothetical protein